MGKKNTKRYRKDLSGFLDYLSNHHWFHGITFLLTGMPLSWEVPVLKGFNFKSGCPLNLNFLHVVGTLLTTQLVL